MNRAADANDVLRNGGVAVLRQHIDRAHVLNGALSDQNNNEQSQVYQPVVVHEAGSVAGPHQAAACMAGGGPDTG